MVHDFIRFNAAVMMANKTRTPGDSFLKICEQSNIKTETTPTAITLWSSLNISIALNNRLPVKEKTTWAGMAVHISTFQAAWRAFIALESCNTLKLTVHSHV